MIVQQAAEAQAPRRARPVEDHPSRRVRRPRGSHLPEGRSPAEKPATRERAQPVAQKLPQELAPVRKRSATGRPCSGRMYRATHGSLPATTDQRAAPACLRLVGRYGAETPRLAKAARSGEFSPVGDGVSLWAELRWAARAEGVVHLDDLLLRRVRLGLLLPEGGIPWLGQIRATVQPELGWTDARWTSEAARYESIWRRAFCRRPVPAS